MFHIEVALYDTDNTLSWVQIGLPFTTFNAAWACARKLTFRCRIVGMGNAVEI